MLTVDGKVNKSFCNVSGGRGGFGGGDRGRGGGGSRGGFGRGAGGAGGRGRGGAGGRGRGKTLKLKFKYFFSIQSFYHLKEAADAVEPEVVSKEAKQLSLNHIVMKEFSLLVVKKMR